MKAAIAALLLAAASCHAQVPTPDVALGMAEHAHLHNLGVPDTLRITGDPPMYRGIGDGTHNCCAAPGTAFKFSAPAPPPDTAVLRFGYNNSDEPKVLHVQPGTASIEGACPQNWYSDRPGGLCVLTLTSSTPADDYAALRALLVQANALIDRQQALIAHQLHMLDAAARQNEALAKKACAEPKTGATRLAPDVLVVPNP